MRFGCHVSVSNGFYKAAEKAREFGADTFQVFTKNPRSFRSKTLDLNDATKGREYCANHNMTVLCHTPYITNLSTPKKDLQQATVLSVVEDLKISEVYGSLSAVVHCGKHVGEGEERGIKRMVETLNQIFEEYSGASELLLENTAGQGTELGYDPETLMYIRSLTKYPDKIGFCFDTAHAFAAGLWNENIFDEFIKKIENIGYLEQIKAIHFNDSKAPFNSKKDRHEKIGKGEIGANALQKFLQCEKLKDISFVLETPVEQEEEYREEIILLHELKNKRNF